VDSYISEERTICLAVISAKNDYANQIILKNCREYDPQGSRTLGIITKPDDLHPGSENERLWLDLARNKDVYFELGWHMLRNRGDGQHHLSVAERNSNESHFFKQGNYRSLPQGITGIDSLRQRLSSLLFDHLKKELPALKEELDGMLKSTSEELFALGKSRSTLVDQKVFLAALFVSTHSTIEHAIRGNYEGDFFGDIDKKAAVDSESNSRRLRAVVQHLNMKFARTMHVRGHQYTIREEDEEDDTAESGDTGDSGGPQTGPAVISRQTAVSDVLDNLERSRGRELPGTFNPMIVSDLFREQSKNWESLARAHMRSIFAACKTFVAHVIGHASHGDVRARLLGLTAEPALNAVYKNAEKELQLILEDKKRHPITYNHYFTDNLQKMLGERRDKDLTQLINWTERIGVKVKDGVTKYLIDPDKLYHITGEGAIEQDMDRYSAEQALDALQAYYKVTNTRSLYENNLV
jgi:uncharacterized protein YdcH (DUF465 family)